MNSFFTFAPKDTASMLNTIPQLSNFQNSNLYLRNTSAMNMEIPNLNTLLNLSPSECRTRASSINNLSPMNNYSQIARPAPAMTPEVESLLLRLKMQQNIQTEMFKNQMQQLIDVKNALLTKLNEQQRQLDQKAYLSSHFSTPSPTSAKATQNAKEMVKVESPVEVSVMSPKISSQVYQSKDLKTQVKMIVDFVLENFGRIGETRIEEEKRKFNFSQDLMTVFDILILKYSSTIKTKEEMVKYTLRRAFKFVKNSVKKQANANTKGVSKVLCNKYFKPSEDDISKLGDEEGFLKFVLPFRKNSKNKTMNTSFISEVFASEEFARDYETYLDNFDAILEADNTGKIDKFISYIEEAIKKGKIQEIKSYKRIPWPKLWILNTKNIAQSLPTIGSQGLGNLNSESPVKKIIKGEQRSFDEMKNSDCRSDASTDSNSNF